MNVQNFWDVIRERRSVRSFATVYVPQESIEKILKAGHIAPSGGNRKNWRFIVIRDKARHIRMKDAVLEKIDCMCAKMGSEKARREFRQYSGYFTFFADAPVVIAVVMKPYDSTTARILKRYFNDGIYESMAGVQSVAAAVENMILAAASLGIGTCWMTGPLIARGALEEILDISAPDSLAALVPAGFPKRKLPPNEFPDRLNGFMTVK